LEALPAVLCFAAHTGAVSASRNRVSCAFQPLQSHYLNDFQFTPVIVVYQHASFVAPAQAWTRLLSAGLPPHLSTSLFHTYSADRTAAAAPSRPSAHLLQPLVQRRPWSQR
jgi:hypothetical protein